MGARTNDQPKVLWRGESQADWPPPSPPKPHTAAHHATPDVEILSPPHTCSTRQTTLIPATFNLVATIVGGGILSVPLAFEKCGVALATILMVFSVVTTDFSLYILCSCSRRTGATSYLEVMRLSFGPGLELCTTLLLFVFLLFVIVAFMVLNRDIWTPIVALAVESLSGGSTSAQGSTYLDDAFGDAVLLGIVVLVFPFLLKRELHALRYNCYLGFASISVLCLAMTYRTVEKYQSGGGMIVSTGDDTTTTVNAHTIRWFPASFADVLFAFPIITLSFMCHFNMPTIHSSLVNPTRKRVRRVIDSAMGASGVLTYTFGLVGYLYAGPDTLGNILLNFDFGDNLVLVGRVGCGITLMLAMAMVTIPCRDCAFALGPQFREWRMAGKKDEKDPIAGIKSAREGRGGPEAGYGSMQPMYELADTGESSMGDEEMISVENAEDAQDSRLLSDGTDDVTIVEDSARGGQHGRFLHFWSTVAIIGCCYVGAVAATGVAVVWSMCGSFMAFLIEFILPTACYINVRASKKGHMDKRVFSAWLLLLFSIAAAMACTVQTIWRLFFMEQQ